jgi:hypothetical protein
MLLYLPAFEQFPSNLGKVKDALPYHMFSVFNVPHIVIECKVIPLHINGLMCESYQVKAKI